MSSSTNVPIESDSPKPASVDLSRDVCDTIAREPGDVVRCTHIHGRFYRCNWWRSVFVDTFINPGWKGGQLGTTYRVTKSSFLEVTRVDGRLHIKPSTLKHTDRR